MPGNLLRLLISGFLSTLSHCVFILGFQATTVDVQVFESALCLSLKMNRSQPVVFFGVPRQDQLASYLHPLIGCQCHRVDGDGIDAVYTTYNDLGPACDPRSVTTMGPCVATGR